MTQKRKNTKSDIETSHRRKSSTYRPRLMDNGMQDQEFGKGTPVAIYIRVSSEEQTEGYSLDAQRQKCMEFANQRQWTVVKVYEDPGFSAKNDERPAFQTMMEDARRGLFKSILIHKLDRFSRNIENTSRYFKELSNLNVMLTSVSENFDFSSGPGRLYFHMMAVFAQWYLENLSAEAVKAKEQMFLEGRHNGSLPFGYIKDEKTNKPVIVDKEAEAIRKAFELYSTGEYRDREIAEFFNQEGFPTRRGRKWSKDTVRNFMVNEFYFGMVAHRDQIAPGIHDPIITRELYEKCMQVRSLHAQHAKGYASPKTVRVKGKKPRSYLLQRIARCGSCGRTLRIQTAGKYKYYKEASGERGFQCSQSAKSMRMDYADDEILDILRNLKLPQDWQTEIEQIANEQDAVAKIEKRRVQIEEKLKRLGKAYTDGTMLEIDYKRTRNDLKNELESLIIPDGADLMERGLVLDSLGAYIDEATESEQSEIVHLLLDAVFIDFDPIKQGVDGPAITRLKPVPDFLPLFEMAAEEVGWKRLEDGIFLL
jgi:DNA invertase Pin-like site-specific DNA recombinase